MRYAGFLVLALAGCVSAPKAPDGVQITVTAEEAERCKENDCALISRAELANIKFQAWMLGGKEAKQDLSERLDSHGCVKGEI